MTQSPRRKLAPLLHLVVLGLGVLGISNSLLASASISAFPDSNLERWTEESFVGNTRYVLLEENGVTVLRATADKTASVLYKRDKVDLMRTPWLDWDWKVDSVYKDINERTKSGDDFPARLYVTARVGLLPWQTIAINYVWSSNQQVGSYWANPYTHNSIMLAVQSGSEKTGQWTTQRRNLADDFKTLFDMDVKQLSGYAIMVDGDNTAQSGSAYFGGIHFSAE